MYISLVDFYTCLRFSNYHLSLTVKMVRAVYHILTRWIQFGKNVVPGVKVLLTCFKKSNYPYTLSYFHRYFS